MDALMGRVRKLLEELEFCVAEGENCSTCPSCYQCKHQHGDQKGHAKDCELSGLLEELRKLA